MVFIQNSAALTTYGNAVRHLLHIDILHMRSAFGFSATVDVPYLAQFRMPVSITWRSCSDVGSPSPTGKGQVSFFQICPLSLLLPHGLELSQHILPSSNQLEHVGRSCALISTTGWNNSTQSSTRPGMMSRVPNTLVVCC